MDNKLLMQQRTQLMLMLKPPAAAPQQQMHQEALQEMMPPMRIIHSTTPQILRTKIMEQTVMEMRQLATSELEVPNKRKGMMVEMETKKIERGRGRGTME